MYEGSPQRSGVCGIFGQHCQRTLVHTSSTFIFRMERIFFATTVLGLFPRQSIQSVIKWMSGGKHNKSLHSFCEVIRSYRYILHSRQLFLTLSKDAETKQTSDKVYNSLYIDAMLANIPVRKSNEKYYYCKCNTFHYAYKWTPQASQYK